MNSGEALAKAGDFGRARSLDLLAYETAIQGMAYHMVAMGWATFDRARRRELLYISERALGNHPLKQFLIALFDPVIRNLARDAAQHVQKGENPGVGPDYAVAELQAEAIDARPPIEEFNAMKNDGLYPTPAGARLKGPSAVTEADYRTLHVRIDRRIRVIRALARSQLPEEDVVAFAEQARLLAEKGRAFDEELLFKLRKVRAAGFKVEEVLEQEAQGRFHDPEGSWRA